MTPLMITANRLTEQLLTQSKTLFYRITDPNKARVLQTKRDNLTYLLHKDLLSLYRTVQQVEETGVSGIFVEAGCALGGSSITIGMAKAKTRPLHVYDAFGMIPPPSDKDDADVHSRYAEIKSGKSKGLGKDTYYGYIENLQEVVEANLARYNLQLDEHHIRLIKGFFEDTLHITEPVAFAHIDCDWYDSVMTCILQIVPNLSLGGVMIFDDYSEWSGCRTAVDDYFKGKQGYHMLMKGRKLHVTKVVDR